MNIPNNLQTIAIFGLAKNTGKTTTLNALIERHKDQSLALTSIGLDGELYDQINFLPKPQIHCPKGTIIATSKSTLNDRSDYKILKETNLQTALGPIVIIETHIASHYLIAGPTSNEDLRKLLAMLKPLAEKIFIDGALNRKTFTQLSMIDGLILATGASVARTMEETINLTNHIVQLFTLSGIDKDHNYPYKVALINDSEKTYYQTKSLAVIKQSLIANAEVYIKGAITDSIIDTVLKHAKAPLKIIAEDPSKWLFNLKKLDYLAQKEIQLSVIHAVKLLFITINPTHPSGIDYPKEAFKKTLQETLNIPVYNVLEGT